MRKAEITPLAPGARFKMCPKPAGSAPNCNSITILLQFFQLDPIDSIHDGIAYCHLLRLAPFLETFNLAKIFGVFQRFILVFAIALLNLSGGQLGRNKGQ